MVDFVQNTLDGVMIGSSYALLALGFTLIFGVMRRLNLSYGPSIMIGAYLGTLVYVQLSAGPLVVVAVTVLGAVLAGLYVERLCFAPMAAGAGVASMVSSFAIWMQLEQAAILVLPRHTYPFPPLATGAPLSLGPFLLRVDHLIMLVCALALSAGVQLLIYRSHFGLALRAIINNPVAAHLVGINVRSAIVRAFALASAVGGIAGYLVLSVDQQVTPMFGMWATIKGLIAMMIGGLGSIPGAILGGLVLGIDRGAQPVVFRPADPRPVRLSRAVRLPGAAAGRPARRGAVREPVDRKPGSLDGRLSGRRPLQYRRHLVHRAVGLSAAAHRRDLVRPAGVLRDRRLCGRHRDRAVGLAARRSRSAGAPPWARPRRCWSACRPCACTGSTSRSRRSPSPKWCGCCSSSSAIRW